MREFRDNFRQYWWQQLLHTAVGATAGLLISTGREHEGITVIALVLGRQGLEFAKRHDTPDIDLFWSQAGFLAGVLGGTFMV